MDSRIKKIQEKIDALNDALQREYTRLAGKYGFSFEKRKILFLKNFRERNRTFRIPAWKYAIPKRLRHFLSMPFIYMMIFPAVLLDICITIYHYAAFSLYHIPKVKRNEYIVYDRQFLDYLNIIQKVHCLYCSYVNGLFAYSLEIAARTERYWCPIKAARRPKAHHGWYHDFADYGNPEEWKEKFNDQNAFKKLSGKNQKLH
jgi:hypothetical protein